MQHKPCVECRRKGRGRVGVHKLKRFTIQLTDALREVVDDSTFTVCMSSASREMCHCTPNFCVDNPSVDQSGKATLRSGCFGLKRTRLFDTTHPCDACVHNQNSLGKASTSLSADVRLASSPMPHRIKNTYEARSRHRQKALFPHCKEFKDTIRCSATFQTDY